MLLASFAPLMSVPTFENLRVIASGWVLSSSKRTVTGIIQRAGAVGTKDHSVFHRFFSRARWSIDMVVTIKRESLAEHFSRDPLLRKSSRKILRLFDESLRPTG
jgi:SRSO17 transposase